jgi:hypothetical protein
MGEPPPNASLDRIDNDGNYTKDNCRWASRAEQRRNARNLRWIEHEGKMMPLKDWAILTGANYARILDRLYRGWPMEQAIISTRQHRFSKRIG